MNMRLYLYTMLVAMSPAMAVSQGTTIVDTTSPTTATIIAGKQYQRGGLYTMFWGKHYRREWTTPVKVPKLRLDTAFGGLKPTETGGGKQTKNLRFEDKNEREYAIRSVDKDYGKALPEVAQGTFVESIVKDQMSVAHPYASMTYGALADAVKVYHTHPKLVFIGDDKTLGKFRDSFANQLYTLEDRPTGDNAKYYGAEDVLDTDEFLEEVMKDNTIRIDQRGFARARLFDMFISDWDRHDDQWEWALYNESGSKLFRAMPKDHDQIYSKFDGLLVRLVAGAANLPYLQGFGPDIKDIEGFNLEPRPLDAQFTNQLTLNDWTAIAKDMQQALTDGVIENAIRLLPPEIFPLSGQEIINNLKSRRDKLGLFAERYYRSLAKAVEIPATKSDEMIEVVGVDEGNLKVKMYAIENGTVKGQAFYERTFDKNETKEIRIYGIDGSDQFSADASTGKDILIRLIGGPGKDTYQVPSSFNAKIYDNDDNKFETKGVQLKLSNDSSVHEYDRKAFKPNDSGLKPLIGYNNEDRIFVGLGFGATKHGWRKEPYAAKHDIGVRYSITQKAFSYEYHGTFIKAIGGWNLGLMGEYDEIKDWRFYGVGNNTSNFTDQKDFFTYRSREINAGLSLFRTFAKHHTIALNGGYQDVKILNDPNRFIALHYAPLNPKVIGSNNFAIGSIEYDFTHLDKDSLVPRKGIRFNTSFQYSSNLENENSVKRITGLFGFYLPLGPLTLAVKTGAATLSGEPEFYQMNRLGGGPTHRAFSRYRFHGKSVVYNQNELQWNFDVKTYIFSGKMGLYFLVDNGRVWQPGETSDKWHTGVGGALMLAPFNKMSVTASYMKSPEGAKFNVRIGHLLRRIN